MLCPPKLNDSLLKRLLILTDKLYKRSNLRCKHVTFILYKNKIISIGINHKKTDTFAHENGYKYPYKHSEMAAIKKIFKFKLNKSKLILINIRKNKKNILYSAPCKNCKNLISAYGIKNVYYSINNEEFGFLTL